MLEAKSHKAMAIREQANDYIELVSKTFDVDVSKIFSTCKKRIYAYPRHFLTYILYHDAKMSSGKIKKLLNRDHKSVFHSLKLCKLILDEKNNYPYREEFVSILQSLEQQKN